VQVPFNGSSQKSKGKSKMIELSAKQTVYVVLTVIAMLAVMIGGLVFWAYDQPNCWELHSSEQAAILNCEN
jgi:hypothetical protein